MKFPPYACASLQRCPPPTQFLSPHLRIGRKNIHCTCRGVFMRPGNSNTSQNSKLKKRGDYDRGAEPFRGKSGSVSFIGLTHQSVDEGKLMTSPFREDSGSLLWVLAPAASVSLFVLQFLVVDAVEYVYRNTVFAEILCSISTEAIFYVAVAVFLSVTDATQRPYLEFSSKRWSLITGLKGYLSSSFFVMGFKVVAPLTILYVTWPDLGSTALVSVAPFLFGCLAQYVFEQVLDRKGSSCWPLLPIIFEVYRLYQLTRATIFIQKLIYSTRESSLSMGAAVAPAVIANRAGALLSLLATFRVLVLICLWSLLTFLMRLFPSRPVAENY
ncbi:hypothetical protein M569_01922 [Genlisea aurea]|uniref:Transmembrane protein n=1 Tax=Genlisea aurea TaxID=192259 RepID=S8D0H5_9LAMI|nr:hypothetical protein M569_01922 [Genlisea aurea]